MKKTIVALFVIANMMYFSSNALADQRFENWQGICHFAYDAEDDDNEVYFANCINTIDTYDAGDGNGRLAYGSAGVTQKYDPSRDTYPKGITKRGDVVKMKGNASTVGGDNFTVADFACVMVTSNYNADADDNNETVYNTNDWDLVMSASKGKAKGKEKDKSLGGLKITYKLNCRGGVAQ